MPCLVAFESRMKLSLGLRKLCPILVPVTVGNPEESKKAISLKSPFSTQKLQSLDVLSLPALRTLGHVELHRLAFLQALEAARLDR